jgi:hypothetical protein
MRQRIIIARCRPRGKLAAGGQKAATAAETDMPTDYAAPSDQEPSRIRGVR